MKIEFTKEDLDYLAVKIAEVIQGNHKMVSTIDADLKLTNIKMSYRLRKALLDIMQINGYSLEEVTLRDVAQFHPDWYKRLRGIGRVAHTELTEWHNIVAWRQTADICEKYVKKGDQVLILGRIKYRSWESNGEKKYATDIVADRVELLGKGEQKPASAPAPQQKPQYKTTPIVAGEPDDYDLPF